MPVHVYTSFSYSYLDRARVLAQTVRKHNPDWTIWAILTDKEPSGYSLDWTQEDFDHKITAEELFGAETDRWLFGHDVVEACTAVKGKALRHIMARSDCDKVVYLDPDIAVFNSLKPVEDLLDHYSIILTPHQLDPENKEDRKAIWDNEIVSLDYGAFNLGFLAVRDDLEGRKFAEWWEERLYDWCHDSRQVGLFVDQKWCNLVPGFFDNVKILRDPGYNVASWNLSRRIVSFTPDGEVVVNGKPLRFFHFTKLGPIGDRVTRRYAKDNIEVHELWSWYRSAVKENEDKRIPTGWWYYGIFDNGKKIEKRARELYRSAPELRERFPAPSVTGRGSFYNWYRIRKIRNFLLMKS